MIHRLQRSGGGYHRDSFPITANRPLCARNPHRRTPFCEDCFIQANQDHIAGLTRAIRNEDHIAFTALYDLLHPELMQYAWQLTRDENAKYDVVQEAFTVLWDKRRTLDEHRSTRAFLYRIVRNLAFKQHRRKRLEQQQAFLTDTTIENTGPSSYDEQVLRSRLDDILSNLSDRRREVFELSRLGLLKHEEIASVLGITPKTVRNHLVAALHYIREQLDHLGIR